MKILFLPAYFVPDQAASSYLSENRHKAFAENGFIQIVYTPIPTRGVSADVRKKYLKSRKSILLNGKLIVCRFYLYREGRKPIFRALRYILCCVKQFNRSMFAEDSKN